MGSQINRKSEEMLHAHLEGYRIYSMSPTRKNEHLWKEYAAGHTGYCLEFATTGVPFSAALRVVYCDALPHIDMAREETHVGDVLFAKRTKYLPEDEVRVMLPRIDGFNGKTLPHEFAFDPPLLRRIILGREASAAHIAQIKEWCRQRVSALRVAFEAADD